MDDGTYAAFGGENTVTVTGDNFATVSDIAANGENISFKVTGANAGDAKLTVAGKVNGKDFSYDLEITVKGAELPRPDNFAVTYDLSINALSDKVPTITDNSYKGEGLYSGTVLYNWTYLDWKRVAKDATGADYNPLDLDKTGAYKLEILNDKHPAGVTNGNTTAEDTAFVMPLASYTNTSATRPHVALRLVVPYAGMYEIAISDGKSTTAEPYVKVFFGEAPRTYDAASIDNLEKTYEFLGWWSGEEGHFAPELSAAKEINDDVKTANKLDKFVVNVPASGE